MKLLTIIGTRPEAVKMAPVLLALQVRAGVQSLLCITGQHGKLLDEPLRFFGIAPDFALDLMDAGQSVTRLVARAMLALDDLLSAEAPDRVIVHGDTATSLAAAQAAFNRGIPVAHVEAGLRTYHPRHPWPEEHVRRSIDLFADQLFAPTHQAARNLTAERVTGAVTVTGNSGLDALHHVIDRLARDAALRRQCDDLLPPIPDRPLILATVHRRESIGCGVEGICQALAALASRGLGEVVLPVHPNPAGEQIRGALAGRPGIRLLPPVPLPAMVRLMQRADLILTDSGGIQEEAPTLGKPVLVLREVTERPEGVQLGLAALTGTCPDRIVTASQAALARIATSPVREVVVNPYGDGRAAGRIVAGMLGEAFEPFAPLQVPAEVAPLRLAV